MWHTQMARTVYCGNLPNISLMTQNLLGTEGWGNYMCLSALVPVEIHLLYNHSNVISLPIPGGQGVGETND